MVRRMVRGLPAVIVVALIVVIVVNVDYDNLFDHNDFFDDYFFETVVITLPTMVVVVGRG